jgi:hypothetical protein
MFVLEHYGKKQFITRVRSLFNVNNIRLNELLETAQFTIMYGLVAFFCGTYINKLFPKFDSSKPSWQILLEILAETVVLSICVFYIRKLVKIIPFIAYFPGKSRYIPYMSAEFEGEIALAVIFVSLQTNLLEKIQELSKRIVGEH